MRQSKFKGFISGIFILIGFISMIVIIFVDKIPNYYSIISLAISFLGLIVEISLILNYRQTLKSFLPKFIEQNKDLNIFNLTFSVKEDRGYIIGYNKDKVTLYYANKKLKIEVLEEIKLDDLIYIKIKDYKRSVTLSLDYNKNNETKNLILSLYNEYDRSEFKRLIDLLNKKA